MDEISGIARTRLWQALAAIVFALPLVVLLASILTELRQANEQMSKIYYRLSSMDEVAERSMKEIGYLRQDVNEHGAQLRRR